MHKNDKVLTQRVGVPSMVSVHLLYELKVTKKIRRLINNRDQPPLILYRLGHNRCGLVVKGVA